MNTTPLSVFVLLVQWTLLLALGWGIHGLVRQGHPRWRLILWRSILCFGLALPVLAALRVPRFRVPAPWLAERLHFFPGAEQHLSLAPVGADGARSSSAQLSAPPRPTIAASSVPVSARPSQPSESMSTAAELPRASVPWSWCFAVVWAVGFGVELVRLIRLQLQLRRIARQATAADALLLTLARQIQGEFGIRRPVRVGISDAISTPLLCGVFSPVILIPRRLAEDLSGAELNALLSHELAHARRHDLAWCIAWRWARAVFWFHPLGWGIPAAHVLACEEEADRIAADRVHEGAGYARLLAQLALRILRAPAPESPLALSATSQLARRLVRLGRERADAWRPMHTLAGLTMAGGLLALTAGWQFAQVAVPVGPDKIATAAANVPTATVLVTVHDESGKPVEGATLTPNGLRAQAERLRMNGYGWRPAVHGAAMSVVTDREGQARITYPLQVEPAEKILTGEVTFSVEHPDYTGLRPAVLVDGTSLPVRLQRGIPLRVAGYFGAKREPLADLVPSLIGDLRAGRSFRPDDWRHEADGALSLRRLAPGKHFLHLSGRLASGEVVYSDGVVFYGEQRDSHDYVLELKPGIRVEGHLDAKVPRPVKNGWVQLSVHSDDANTDENSPRLFDVRSGNTGFWFSYRPVAADGSFVFESVPRGDIIHVIAYGDGFISANGVEAPRQILSTPLPVRRATRAIPQSFDAVRPVTKLEVATEPTVTLTVVATAGGKPVEGAKVYVWPNVAQMPTGSRIFAGSYPSSEAPFRTLPPLPETRHSAFTDRAGVAVLREVPAFTPSFDVQHEQLEVPLREPTGSDPSVPVRFRGPPDHHVALNLTPGQPATVNVTLQPRGREFAGAAP